MNWDIKNSCSVCIHITTLKKKKRRTNIKKIVLLLKYKKTT